MSRFSYWYQQSHSPLGDDIASFMAEHLDKVIDTWENGAHFHYVIANALRAPTSEDALGILLHGLADMQEHLIRLTELQTSVLKSRLARGVVLLKDETDVDTLVKLLDRPATE